MINPKRFVAPFINRVQIATEVERIRLEHPVCRSVPVNVLAFAEFDLELAFDFKPIAQFGQDAFLLHDFSGIVLDKAAFEERNLNRLRFSVAHELGHFFLHRDLYGKVGFNSVEEWINFSDQIPGDQYQWIEWQADEFAGQLLMPPGAVATALDETMSDAKREGYFPLGADALLDFCCKAMHQDFGVSRQAMQTRLRSGKFWPHRDVPPAAPVGA